MGPVNEWDNPADTPPVTPVTSTCIPTVEGIVFNGSTGVGDTMKFTIHAGCDDDSIVRFFWSFDSGKTFDSTSGDTYLRFWNMEDTGAQVLNTKVLNKRGAFSDVFDTSFVVGVSYPYLLYRISDTIVHQYAEIQKALVAADDDGNITRYYWSTQTDGWSDSTNSAAGTILTLKHPEGGPVTVRWAAIDDDGLMVYDTFTVFFNEGPDSIALVNPDGSEALFKEYNLAENKGTIFCRFSAHDPDPDDTLEFAYLVVGDNSDTLIFYRGRKDTLTLIDVPASSTLHWWLMVSDLFGDSLSTSGSFVSQRPPEMPKGMVLVPAPASGFRMGQSGFDTFEEPIHPVTFVQGFLIDSTEVTIQSYNSMMHRDFDTAKAQFPVGSVTWFDAVLYCNEKSKISSFDTVYTYTQKTESEGHVTALKDLAITYTKYGFRLPTEAEWDYACKLDSLTLYFWGNDYAQADLFCWTSENSEGKKHRVATKRPSKINIYDMAGNVWEWCDDWFDADYYQNSPVVDPTGPSSGTGRIIRGGSYQHSLFFAQAATRSSLEPARHNETIGFRTVIKAR